MRKTNQKWMQYKPNGAVIPHNDLFLNNKDYVEWTPPTSGKKAAPVVEAAPAPAPPPVEAPVEPPVEEPVEEDAPAEGDAPPASEDLVEAPALVKKRMGRPPKNR